MVLKLNKEVVMPTRPPRRGLSVGVRDEDVNVGAPTLWADDPHFDGKAVIYTVYFF